MRGSSKTWTRVLLAVIALGGCALPSSLTAEATRTSPASAPRAGADGKLVMLDLTGKTADEAERALRAAGFSPSLEVNRILLECEGASSQEGRITCQAPTAGELADRRAIINVSVHEGPRDLRGSLVRAQLVKMRGMTIADARAYLRRLGHDGEVETWEQPTFSSSCGTHKVCDVSPEAGTGIHDPITLVINPSSNVDISLPP